MKEQFIHIDKHGNKFYYSDESMAVRFRHREDGPAVEWSDGSKTWYIGGKCHREDGPAIEWDDGSKEWYINGERHRKDGPAIEWDTGGKEWYINGERHREDGPAIEYSNGGKAWYIYGKKLTEEEFNDRNKAEFTLDEIAEKLGVSVDLIKIKE